MHSYYENVKRSSVHDDILTIDEIVTMIKNSPNRKLIEELHAVEYKCPRYIEIKEKLPCITPAGVFKNSRSPEEILKLSGYMFFDVDVPGIIGNVNDYKSKLTTRLKDYVSVLGISVGGRGIFFYLKFDRLTSQNYTAVFEYYKNVVFKDIAIDNNCKGINRPQILPYDPNVYFNPQICLTIPEFISNEVLENRTFNIKIKKERCYTLNVQFYPIDEVLARLRLETEVSVADSLFDINPVDYLKVFIPKMIEDGNKHRVFRGLTEAILFLNPDADLLTIQSFINYVNCNHTTQKMDLREMIRTVEHTFNKVKSTGELHINLKTKTLHFNKSIQMSGHEKKKVAAKVNGLIQTFKSVARIRKAKEEINVSGDKVTKAKVSELTGLCYKTISRNWNKSLEDIADCISDCNTTVKVMG